MKKLVLALAVAFGASMVACSSSEKEANAEGQENAQEAVEVVEEEAVVAVDTAAADTAAADTAATDSVK